MLRWVDGFEHYGAVARMTEGIGGGAAWSEVDEAVAGNGWELSTANPATGTYHLRLLDGFDTSKKIRRILGTSKQVAGWGYRFAVADLPSTEGIAGVDGSALILADIRDASNLSQFIVVLGTDGSVFARRGAAFEYQGVGGDVGLGGELLGRSDPCVAPGGYHHFEIKSKIDGADGFIEVRVNEVTVLNLTGIDTQSTANAVQAQLVVGRAGALNSDPAGFGTFDFDDPFAWDDDASDAENTIVDFVGDKGAYWLKPDSDTATSEFTVTNSVTAYGAINEVPPSGTSYLDTELAAARTIVGLEPLPGNVAEVIALVPLLYARKDESGTVLFRGGIVSGSAESYGPEDNPSTEYAYLRPGPKTVDPATGVPWANTATPSLLIERTA